MWELLSGISILILCSVHVFFPYLERSLDRYKKTWVPVVGGIGVGYVFMSLMPKLSDYTVYMVNADYAHLGFLKYRIYLFALLGFMAYFALDVWGESESRQTGKLNMQSETQPKVTSFGANSPQLGVSHAPLPAAGLVSESDESILPYGDSPWLEVYRLSAAGSFKRTMGFFFCIYSFFVGYLLHEFSRTGVLPTILGTLALGLHFMGTDHVLNERHPVFFKKVMRWLLAGSLVAGWLTGMIAVLPKMIQMVVISFVSGAILINVMTNELPRKEKRRYLEFLAGVVFFVIVVLIVRSYPKV